MESKINSSFIPKDATQLSGERQRYGGSASGLYDVAVLLSLVLLVASVALAAGVFLYVQYLSSSLGSKRAQLERAQAAFEPTLISELTRLDDRMRAAESVLQQHAAPSILFKLLEDLTLSTVSFRNMKFEVAVPGAAPTITMQGTAQSVNSIALQADLFGKHPAIVSPIFSNINRERDVVRFDVTAEINPTSLKYANTLEGGAGSGAPAGAPAQPASSGVPLFAP